MFFATDQSLIQQHTEQDHNRNNSSNSSNNNDNTNSNCNNNSNKNNNKNRNKSNNNKNNDSNNNINQNTNKSNNLSDQQNMGESTKELLTVTQQQNNENISGKIETQPSTKDRLRSEKRKNGKIKKVVETQQNTNAESVNRNQKVARLKQRPINEINAEHRNFNPTLSNSNNFDDCENNNKQVFEAKSSENYCLIDTPKSSEDFLNVEFSNQCLPVHHSSNISNNFAVCENNNKQVFEPKNSENVCLIETLNSSEGSPNVESSTKSLPVFKEKKNAELQAVISNELVENGHEVNFFQSEERHFPSNEKSGREEKSFNNRFECHYCNKAYISRKSLLRHTKAKHPACHRCGESIDTRSLEKHVCGGKDVQSQTKEKILLTDNEKESGNLISDLKKVTQSQSEADNNHQFENESSSKKAAAGNCK
jgi:hypothetical protein